MEVDFFLDIADNTGDRFSYEILPVNTVNKISKHRNLVTLTRSLVDIRVVDSSDAPMCIESKAGF